MNTLNRRDFPGELYPERIIQFGEGNFLRAFIDWQIDLLNEHTDLNSGIVIVRPIQSDFPPSLSTQDGLLHHDHSRIERAGRSRERCTPYPFG
ncbi:altronate oxidoreductase [Enterobacter cancerogenus]|uniref:Altronate oxidoreductase n=1 Tax=Enterobacter cancerogenus TaxID=69218 RepID=A0A484XNC0_9ENTR|nr:altronate oxidoreductase [Enterobacter cancerogenus]